MSLIDAAGWDAMCPPEKENEQKKEEAKKTFTPGKSVWIVERDEDGNASEVTGYLFLAEVADAVIVTPRISGRKGLEETMAYYIETTAEYCEADLRVFPSDDCYLHKHDAEKALAFETEYEEE